MKEKALYVVAGVLLGIFLAPQIAKIPGVSRIPTL